MTRDKWKSVDGYFIRISNCQMSSGFSNLPWSPPTTLASILGSDASAGQIQIICNRSSYLLSSVTCPSLCFCASHSLCLDPSLSIRRKSLSEQALTISDISPPAAKPPVDRDGSSSSSDRCPGCRGREGQGCSTLSFN